MSYLKTIPALDALSEAAQLTAQVRNSPSHGLASDSDALRLADAIDRQTAVLRMVVDCLSKHDMDPLDVLNGLRRPLPTVSVPPSRRLE